MCINITDCEYFVHPSHPAFPDRLLATRLSDKPNNFQVWLDKWVLIPGESWQQAMARGLEQAKTCAVCIGQQTPKGWFREEVERALNRQTKDASFRVIPVILPGGGPALVEIS
jgi:hypothetical protein